MRLPIGELMCVALALAAAAYLRALRQVPPGRHRLAAAVPVLAAFALAPLLFDPQTNPAAVILSINFPWLSGSAVLCWAAGRGPLAQPLPFRAFLAFLGAPALPAAPGSAGQYRPSTPAVAAKVAALAAAALALACLDLQAWLLGALQSVTLFLFTSLGMECAAAVARLLSGMPVVAHFDRPYLSCSLSDFWSRRWNVVAGLKFRSTVYDPICYGHGSGNSSGGGNSGSDPATAASRRVQPAPWRRAAGVCAAFAASGAVHELALFYLTRRLSGWWMLFFCLQGPLLILEGWLRWLGRQARFSLPRPLRIAATLGLLHYLAQRLFFPDLVASGVPARLLQQLWSAAGLGHGPVCWPRAA